MKNKKFIPITLPDINLAAELTRSINKDYPDQAKVENDCCYITAEHMKKCKDYVQTHCKIRKDK